ncbi:MAG: redox-sensitive transcriptional activator SoxR [Pseudomonadota bacterium]
MPQKPYLSIGEVAERCGIATSALRFYESRGLIQSHRGSGNQRRFHRSVIRKVSVIKVAQTLGISLQEILDAFSKLPDQRTPTRRDWERLSTLWRVKLDARISALERLRDQLDGCIGCGCLSLKRCALYNPDDEVFARGSGPHFLRQSEG